jgi:hypothetical protein
LLKTIIIIIIKNTKLIGAATQTKLAATRGGCQIEMVAINRSPKRYGSYQFTTMVAVLFNLGKVYITPSNYHFIVNVPPKLLIVSMSPPKLPKTVNVPLMTKISFRKLLK